MKETSTGATRVSEHNRRRRAAGQVLVTVRVWTDGEESAGKAREKMRRVAKVFATPAPPVND